MTTYRPIDSTTKRANMPAQLHLRDVIVLQVLYVTIDYTQHSTQRGVGLLSELWHHSPCRMYYSGKVRICGVLPGTRRILQCR